MIRHTALNTLCWWTFVIVEFETDDDLRIMIECDIKGYFKQW